jgi:hypothetical protein
MISGETMQQLSFLLAFLFSAIQITCSIFVCDLKPAGNFYKTDHNE